MQIEAGSPLLVSLLEKINYLPKGLLSLKLRIIKSCKNHERSDQKTPKNFQLPAVTLQTARGKKLGSILECIQLGFIFCLVKMNYVRTSDTPVSSGGIFKEIAQMYIQNVNYQNNSVFTYEVTTFPSSHNQRFTESLLYIFMSFS